MKERLLNQKLIEAIEKGNVPDIKKYLNEDVDPDVTNKYDTPALHLIIQSEEINLEDTIELIELCLVKGADINATDSADNTALHRAVELKSGLRIVEKLVEQGIKIRWQNFYGEAARDIAEGNGFSDIHEFIANQEAIFNARIELQDRMRNTAEEDKNDGVGGFFIKDATEFFKKKEGGYEEKPPEEQEIKDIQPACIIFAPAPPLITSYTTLQDSSALKGKKSSYMGEKGMLAEIKGEKPGEDDVRQRSKKGVGGLHEIVPTDLREEISHIPDEAKENPPNKLRSHVAQVQSGARTSTRLTFFKKEDKGEGKIAAHSYAFENNAHTAGQSKAHDELRTTVRAACEKKLTGEKLIVATVRKQFELMAYPEDMLTDTGLTGNVSTIPDIGEIKAPDPNDAVQKTSSRFRLAERVHIGREQAKQRLRTLKRSTPGLEHEGKSEGQENSPTRVASPSPPRRSLFFTNPHPTPEPLPGFPGTHPVANQAAWVTEPLRLKPDEHSRSTSTVERTHNAIAKPAGRSVPTRSR